VACKLGTNLSQVAAIDVIGVPDSLDAYDTLRPLARVFDGRGDSVPGAVVRWYTLDPAILSVDSVTGVTRVGQVGPAPGRLEARTGSLFSNPTSIQPLAGADTVFADSSTTLTDSLPTAPAPSSIAGPLRVTLANTTLPPSTTGLPGRPIVFTIIRATTPGSATLVTTDTTRTFLADTVITNGAGIGSVSVHLLPGSPTPDSVIVTAGAIRDRCLGACASSSIGVPVPGSPVTFVVRFVR
jgi:hypothetical protein